MNEQLKQTVKKIIYSLFITLFVVSGILNLVLITNLNSNTDFMFLLSQKLRKDAYIMTETRYNKEFNQNKNFGEFCYRFFGDELRNKKIRLSLDEQKIRGMAYANGNLYGSKINPQSLEMEMDDQAIAWQWKWYNWLGIGLDEVITR